MGFSNKVAIMFIRYHKTNGSKFSFISRGVDCKLGGVCGSAPHLMRLAGGHFIFFFKNKILAKGRGWNKNRDVIWFGGWAV